MAETIEFYSRFDERVKEAMQFAQKKATQLNHKWITAEHILLGIIENSNSLAVKVLENLDVDLGNLRFEVEKIYGPDPNSTVPAGGLQCTSRVNTILEHSLEESRNLGDSLIGTEHLLLGLLHERDGIAARTLLELGLNLEKVRKEILLILDVEAENKPTLEETPTSSIVFSAQNINPKKLLAFASSVNGLMANQRADVVIADSITIRIAFGNSELHFLAKNITPRDLIPFAKSVTSFALRCEPNSLYSGAVIKEVEWKDDHLEAIIVEKNGE